MKVKNNIIGFLYNNFDFLIRFIYCKIPLISKILFWKLYSSDFKCLDNNFEEMKKIINDSNLNLKGRVCLELGPGNSYINAYNLLMNGAKKIILVDKFPRNNKTKKQKKIYCRELDFIRKKYGKKDLFFLKNGKLDSKYIKFIEGDFVKIDFKERIDFVLTISVLEHIKNIEEVIKRLGELVHKNGLMYHSIDLRDHYNFNKPFLFYKYSNKTWEKYLTKEGISCTNRIRYNQFIDLFKKNHFEILKEEKIKYHLNSKNINKEFKKQTNLDVGILRGLLRK